MARDLREEFYAYFQQFFERLIKLLDTKNADQTEWTLVCLAFLFKVLKPFLCKDISIIIHQIIPLLSDKDQPEHVVNFAVECFAFLVRNIKDKDSFLLSTLKIVKNDENCITGCGKLFFEMIRGLNGQFHSKGEEFLNTLLDSFHKVEFKKYWDTLKEVSFLFKLTNNCLLNNLNHFRYSFKLLEICWIILKQRILQITGQFFKVQ